MRTEQLYTVNVRIQTSYGPYAISAVRSEAGTQVGIGVRATEIIGGRKGG